jgi:cytochrome c oxidase cbb3-type subunit 2
MPKALETQKSIALLAGVGCYFLALFAIVLIPEFVTNASEPKVRGIDGKVLDVHDYTKKEALGREVYGNQICWHCHSQFVRPVNDEDRRWGPVSQTGEYAFDQPHFFGTRRVGPDLAREGGLRPDDWQLAHLWNPRWTVSRSVMPAFLWLFHDNPNAAIVHQVLDVLDTDGDGVYSAISDDLSDPADASLKRQVEEARALAKDPRADAWGVMAPASLPLPPGRYAEVPAKDLIVTDYDARPLSKLEEVRRASDPAHHAWSPATADKPEETDRADNLVAYLQRLGTNIGKWRKPIYVTAPPRRSPFEGRERPRKPSKTHVHGWIAKVPERVAEANRLQAEWEKKVSEWGEKNPDLAQRVARGKELFEKHCASCHGTTGQGNGDAAQFLQPRPRDFTLGKFKYRSTDLGSLPLDGDLYRSISRGLPGTAMPTWRELGDEQIWFLVDYVKTFYEGDKAFNDYAAVMLIPPERKFSEKDPAKLKALREKELLRGRAIYLSLQCVNCHGVDGRADISSWNDTSSDYKSALRPRDLKPRDANDQPALRFRGGAAPEDIYRTIFTGLDGTQMKSQRSDFWQTVKVATEKPDFPMRDRPVNWVAVPKDPEKKLFLPFMTGRKADPSATPPQPEVVAEPELATVGVVHKEDGDWLKLQVGDDWALVHYVMSLAGIDPRDSGG